MPEGGERRAATEVLRLPLTGAELPAALSEAQQQRFRLPAGLQERQLMAVRHEGRMAGLALVAKRPVTVSMKVTAWWLDPAVPAAAEALRAAAEAEALAQGAAELRVEAADAETLAPWLAAGYRRLPAPEHLEAPPQGAAKALRPLPQAVAGLPWYGQSTGFTCGPCCLAMALAALGGGDAPSRGLEIDLWREATLVHAPAGPGGCDPFGLALAARRRGLDATVFITSEQPILLDRATDEAKRELSAWVQRDFRARCRDAGVRLEPRAFAVAELGAAVEQGAVAVVLIDEAAMHEDAAPHWIAVHAHHSGLFAAHDPWIDQHLGESWIDGRDLLLPAASLDRLAWYGLTPYRAAVLLRPS